MIADSAAEFTKAIGMDFTAPPVGLYDRSKRYALMAEDGVVKVLNEEGNPGECEISAGEALLDAI
jgi:cytochrome c peroxidase